MKPRDNFDRLLASIYNLEWKFDEYTATHKWLGTRIWIYGIPVLSTEMYPVPAGLTLLEKRRLWKALRRARRDEVLSAFVEGEE